MWDQSLDGLQVVGEVHSELASVAGPVPIGKGVHSMHRLHKQSRLRGPVWGQALQRLLVRGG